MTEFASNALARAEDVPTAGRLTGSNVALATKRGIDVAVSASALLLLMPLMLLVASAIAIVDRRGPLERQAAIGRGGRRFDILGFATTPADGPSQAHWGSRRTALGRTLHETSLAELPRLWNVLRGEMSLVGPRPVPFEAMGPAQTATYAGHPARPGITGRWQHSRRPGDAPDAGSDADYARTWSLRGDLEIAVRSVVDALARR